MSTGVAVPSARSVAAVLGTWVPRTPERAEAAADADAVPPSTGVAEAARAAAEVSDRGVDAGVSEPLVDVPEDAEPPIGVTGVEAADPFPEAPPGAKAEANDGPP
jgi:hypothetical protein